MLARNGRGTHSVPPRARPPARADLSFPRGNCVEEGGPRLVRRSLAKADAVEEALYSRHSTTNFSKFPRRESITAILTANISELRRKRARSVRSHVRLRVR